ncbi:nitroreductase [Echria macrotheca]|uniref:Nitroreductase n=1 Tax=Echria macrotheca TaxID=438768 RepID=A0AAJ0B7Q0_9PEZI|nr:nitroreductase [Echria macrotheca]
MSASTQYLRDAIKNRGSLHALSDDVQIPDSIVIDTVRHAILNAPTPFNCQSGRAVVLLKEEHKKFWDMAYDVSKAAVAPPVFEKAFGPRIKMFRAAYGTILFYESGAALEAQAQKTPMVKDKLPEWSEQSNGMLEYAVWTMLTAEGFGVNLQHYNPIVDAATAKQWGIPADWSLKAQMVFGKPTGPRIMEKTFEPVEDRMKVFGA